MVHSQVLAFIHERLTVPPAGQAPLIAATDSFVRVFTVNRLDERRMTTEVNTPVGILRDSKASQTSVNASIY